MAETAADGSKARTLDDDAKEQQPQSQSQPQPQSQSQQQSQSQEQADHEEGTSPRRRLSTSSTSSRPREATELDDIATASTQSTASLSSGEYRITPRLSLASSSDVLRRRRQDGPFQPLRRFWSRNVALVVEQKGNRDYFALERTFLAYTRTSAAFSMQGVLIAQVFRLQSAVHTSFDFRTVGVPLSIAYQCCAIVIAMMGAYRFWRQQNAIARGKVVVGGWEINSMGLMTLLAGLVLLALAIAIIIELSKA